MSSPKQFAPQSIDLLIEGALRAQVGDAEPSLRVWHRVRQQAIEWAARRRRRGVAWRRNGYWTALEFASSMPLILHGDVVYYRHNLATVRFLGYGAMMLRFGW